MRGGDLNRVASEALQRVSGTNVARGEVGEAPNTGQDQNGVDPEADGSHNIRPELVPDHHNSPTV